MYYVGTAKYYIEISMYYMGKTKSVRAFPPTDVALFFIGPPPAMSVLRAGRTFQPCRKSVVRSRSSIPAAARCGAPGSPSLAAISA